MLLHGRQLKIFWQPLLIQTEFGCETLNQRNPNKCLKVIRALFTT